MGDETFDQHKIYRAVADHLVGDADLALFRVLGPRRHRDPLV
jgi:hypothetical protein